MTLQTIIAWNTLWAYIVSAFLFILCMGIRWLWTVFLVSWLKRISKNIKKHYSVQLISILLSEIRNLPFVFVALRGAYLSVQHIYAPHVLVVSVDVIIIVCTAYQLTKIASVIVSYLIRVYRFGKSKDDHTSVSMIVLVTQIIIWIVALLSVLINLNVEITPILASFGIWGIAVAFALQNILSDTFSSFSIFLGKPFQTGDFVMIGMDSGTVQDIGLQTTRIKTTNGQMLTIPNKDIQNSRINNFSDMESRTEKVILQLPYDTSVQVLKELPSKLEMLIQRFDSLEFVRAKVRWLWQWSINLELVYVVTTREFDIYVDRQHDVNLALLELFESEWISFAYPTSIQYSVYSTKPLVNG